MGYSRYIARLYKHIFDTYAGGNAIEDGFAATFAENLPIAFEYWSDPHPLSMREMMISCRQGLPAGHCPSLFQFCCKVVSVFGDFRNGMFGIIADNS